MADSITTGWGVSTDWESMFSTALDIGAGQVANPANTIDTVPVNALQSMQPVSQAGEQSWSGFWKDITKGVLGYAVAKDAAQSGVAPVVRQQGTAAVVTMTPRQAAQQQQGSLLLLVVVAGIAYAAAKG